MGRRWLRVSGLILLVVGVALLAISLASRRPGITHSATGVQPTVTLSPVFTTVPAPGLGTGYPSPGEGPTPTPIVITSYVAVPTYVSVPPGDSGGSGLLTQVTTVSGLLASVAGVVSAIVSIRDRRPRPRASS
jgi:hypothetical protein